MGVVPIDFEVANDLAFWRAEVPGKVAARAEALTGPNDPTGLAGGIAERAGL